MQTKLIGLLGSRRLPNLPSPPDVSYLDPEVVLPNWKRNEFFLKKLFSEPDSSEASEKFDKLRHSRQIGSENRQIFMFSYENRWAIAGGLFKVSLRFPEEFNRFVANQSSSSGAPQIYRLSPLHSNLSSSIPQGTLIEARERAAQLLQCESIANHEMRLKDLDTKSASFIARSAVHLRPNGSPITRVCYLGNCSVRFGAPDAKGDRPGYLVDIYLCCDLENGDEWILFGNDYFFNGDVSPYHYSVAPQGRELISKQLEHDALFAAKAAPYVVAHLGFREPVFHLQDWHCFPVGLTAKEAVSEGVLDRVATVGTLHNLYDRELCEADLIKITDLLEPHRWPSIVGETHRKTFLTRMIPLLDAPPAGVSADFIHDVLSAPSCFGASGELVGILKEFGVVGVMNGTFESVSGLAISEEIYGAPKSWSAIDLLRFKAFLRESMLNKLANSLAELRERGAVIGKLREESPGQPLFISSDAPIFLMIGRFAPNQKGQDLLLEAIDRLPKDLNARFIIGAAGLSESGYPLFFKRAAEIVERSDGRVIVINSFFRGELLNLLRMGPNFAVMPSLFEPCGMVSEFSARLTPVIAHATGGLRRLVHHYDPHSKSGSGFLFGAGDLALWGLDSQYDLDSQWKLIRGQYDPQKRLTVPLYRALIEGLSSSLNCAFRIFGDRPEDYGKMLANLKDQTLRFEWAPSIERYLRLFEVACN